MKHYRILIISLVVVSCVTAGVAQVKRPYRDGSVWDIEFVRMNAGFETQYLSYLADEWKRERETMKKDGHILSYKVLQTEPHGLDDFNLMLMTEYKDAAAVEASRRKEDEVYQQVTGDDEKQREGYRKRLEVRNILGSRFARETVLEPKQ